jgi:hypothetical protein
MSYIQNIRIDIYNFSRNFLANAEINEDINREYWHFVMDEIIKEYDNDYDFYKDDFYDFIEYAWDEYSYLEYWADF